MRWFLALLCAMTISALIYCIWDGSNVGPTLLVLAWNTLPMLGVLLVTWNVFHLPAGLDLRRWKFVRDAFAFGYIALTLWEYGELAWSFHAGQHISSTAALAFFVMPPRALLAGALLSLATAIVVRFLMGSAGATR